MTIRCRLLLHTIAEPVAEWHEKLEDTRTGQLCQARCPVCSRLCDLASTSFADDLARKHVAATAAEARDVTIFSNNVLDDALRKKGMSQNRTKQEIVV